MDYRNILLVILPRMTDSFQKINFLSRIAFNLVIEKEIKVSHLNKWYNLKGNFFYLLMK
ncbi:hypothetical protein J2736_000330 [Paenibacillus qinlingensis]|uniref:Uncharacterized protein n=1 Tax=Paenibacillus qinlingensis TaxID=1837343 RepID=A0ABU1NNV6_9BACL|nr:hypothetical protein [Paenibacillus qinlingensis]